MIFFFFFQYLTCTLASDCECIITGGVCINPGVSGTLDGTPAGACYISESSLIPAYLDEGTML